MLFAWLHPVDAPSRMRLLALLIPAFLPLHQNVTELLLLLFSFTGHSVLLGLMHFTLLCFSIVLSFQFHPASPVFPSISYLPQKIAIR